MSEQHVRALIERWQQDVSNLHAANEDEAMTSARRARNVRAAEIERCAWELREALSAPESNAEPSTPVTPPTAVGGETTEAQEAPEAARKTFGGDQ
jgi:hypothetical protein